jgi:hypothetical protein
VNVAPGGQFGCHVNCTNLCVQGTRTLTPPSRRRWPSASISTSLRPRHPTASLSLAASASTKTPSTPPNSTTSLRNLVGVEPCCESCGVPRTPVPLNGDCSLPIAVTVCRFRHLRFLPVLLWIMWRPLVSVSLVRQEKPDDGLNTDNYYELRVRFDSQFTTSKRRWQTYENIYRTTKRTKMSREHEIATLSTKMH